MAFTTRLLVVANRTADSGELFDELRSRAESGPLTVTFVLPAPVGRDQEVSRHLDRVLERTRALGIEAAGTVGDADPVNAALDVWDPMRFDEIVVCTLPQGESTWLHIDLPHRLRRMTDATVTHVVAHAASPPPVPVPQREHVPWFQRLVPLQRRPI